MVMEEPDIEIGAGVSSKAISRRLGGFFGSGRRPDRSPYDDGAASGVDSKFSGIPAMLTGTGNGMPPY